MTSRDDLQASVRDSHAAYGIRVSRWYSLDYLISRVIEDVDRTVLVTCADERAAGMGGQIVDLRRID